MSLSMQILDLYDDVGRNQLLEISTKAPEFIKTAHFSDKEETAKLSTEDFALHMLTKEGSRLKKYPIHTQSDTWMSASYFEKNAHKLPLTAAKIAATHIKQACELFNVEPNKIVNSYALESAPTNLYVEENDMKKMASVVEIENRPSGGMYALNNKYPLFTEKHIKQAAEYFVNYFGQFDPKDRNTYSTNLQKRASELNVKFDGEAIAFLNKVAGEVYGDKVTTQIMFRRNLFDGNVKAIEQLDKVASAQDTLSPNEFANLLNAWDQEYNVSSRTARYILDPYQATFDRELEKEAGYIWEDSNSGMSLTGKELEKAADAKFAQIKSYFGETLASSLKKHGSAIFESLPVDAKTVIAKIAKGDM